MKEKSLIIGSHAMRHHFPDFSRLPVDRDYISHEKIMTKLEQHYWVPSFQYILDNNQDEHYIDPDFLLTLKMSHAGWNIFWEKTMFDILFLKSKGAKCNKILYNSLVKDWIKVHGRQWASLKNKDSKTFFEDAVPRKYVHDDIHDAVAVYERPLFERLLFEGVSCSEKGFEQLSFEDKLLLVKEEVWVTALERFLIPSDFACGQMLAYMRSLKKLATTMSSGWFKFFILDNYDKLCINRDKSYIEKFKEAEKQGKLRKYENGN